MKAAVIVIGLLLFGCGENSNDKKNADPGFDLANSTPISNLSTGDLSSIAISWSFKSDTKPFKVNSVVLENDSDITAIVESISVVNGDKDTHVALVSYGQIRFFKRDGQTIEASFVKRSQLDVSQWGQVYLHEDLYSTACEYASKAENRSIDVLAIN